MSAWEWRTNSGETNGPVGPTDNLTAESVGGANCARHVPEICFGNIPDNERPSLVPNLPLRPCTFSSCPALTTTGRCPQHQRQPKPIIQPRKYDDRRGSSTQRGYGYAWQQQRKKFIAAHPFCRYCPAPTQEVDHIIPRARGGSDDDSNLQPLCKRHHNEKTGRERRA